MPLANDWTDDHVRERFAQGHGQGRREHYMPWRYVRSFSSIGTATRVPSLLFPRTIQTFSYFERNMYLLLEYRGNIVDFREQFPLDRKVTLAAARAGRIRHPRYTRTGVAMVMEADALVERPDGSMEVWDAKPKRLLQDQRVMELLGLHKAYADHMGFRYCLFTEDTVSKRTSRNIDLIRSGMPKSGELLLPVDLFSKHMLVIEKTIVRNSRTSIQKFCLDYDVANKLPRGSALRLVWCLLWSHRLETNLDVENLPLTPLCLVYRGARSVVEPSSPASNPSPASVDVIEATLH